MVEDQSNVLTKLGLNLGFSRATMPHHSLDTTSSAKLSSRYLSKHDVEIEH
jgi:hypothetical protein